MGKNKNPEILIHIILGPYVYPRIPLEYPSIPFECPRIPQNTNNIMILKDFGFLFFYSVDGDISQKAMLIELLFVLLDYWSLVLFFIIIFVNSIYFEVFFFNFGDC